MTINWECPKGLKNPTSEKIEDVTMTDEEKKEAEAKAKADAEAAEAAKSDEDKAKEAAEKEALKTLAAQERERREKAEKALADQRFHEAEERRKKKEAGEEIDEKPLTPSELRAILAEDRQSTQKELLGSQIAEKAKKLSDSPEEAELIVEIHRGRTFPAHMTLDEQLAEAKAIGLGKKLMAQNDELKRSLRGKESVVIDSGSTHKDVPKPGEPKLDPQDKAELQRLGFAWDGKYFSKKLANGKTLSRDWRTKKTIVR